MTGRFPQHSWASRSDQVEAAAKAAWQHQTGKLDPERPAETWEQVTESTRNLWRTLAMVMLDAAQAAAPPGLSLVKPSTAPTNDAERRDDEIRFAEAARLGAIKRMS